MSSKVYVISVCHMDPRIIEHSILRFFATNISCINLASHWVFVDHHWPLDKEITSQVVNKMSCYVESKGIGSTVIKPDKNLGGHGGMCFAIDYLKLNFPISSDDLILIYDPDSNPETVDWLKSMVDVMTTEPRFAYVSLTIKSILSNYNLYARADIGAHKVVENVLDMINVTMFKASFLLTHGVTANTKFYGGIEVSMVQKARDQGLKTGYLIDQFEIGNPIPHPDIYNKWKGLHACGKYCGNFDQFINKKDNS
jgi:hypothetical protein